MTAGTTTMVGLLALSEEAVGVRSEVKSRGRATTQFLDFGSGTAAAAAAAFSTSAANAPAETSAAFEITKA
jgi:hypothetical protein